MFGINTQGTLRQAIEITGTGLHSGRNVRMVMRPAAAGFGIVFKRVDLHGQANVVPADALLVTETCLGTTLQNEAGVKVCTVEHVMAALWGCGVHNALIELDAEEVPIMDGSSAPFVHAIEKAGVVWQTVPLQFIEVLKPVEVEENGSYMRIAPHNGFILDVEIEFNNPAIARQRAVYDFGLVSFNQMLSRARTFGFEQDVAYLRSKGLARGGSLENAIVVGKDGVLNPEGLRYDNEFVRHKALDCVGDFYLAGAPLLGRISAYRPGHGINNKLMRALLADSTAWRWKTGAHPATSFTPSAQQPVFHA